MAAREREGAGIPHSWELGECGPGRAGGGRGSGPGELAGSGPALGELGEPFTRFPERGAPQGRPEKGVSGGRLWGGMREGWGRLSARARTRPRKRKVCVGSRDWGEEGAARRGSEDLLGGERGRVNRGVPGEGMGGLKGAAERESLGAVMGF